MSAVRPWHYVLFAAAILALVGSAVWAFFGQNRVPFSNRVHLVDVKTGELFSFSTEGRGIGIPAIHPDTGERTLYSIGKDDSDRWVIDGRSIPDIREGVVEVNAEFIDPQTGVVSPARKSIRDIKAEDLLKHLGGGA